MLNKKIFTLIMLIAAAAFIVSSCGKKEEPAATPADEAVQAQQETAPAEQPSEVEAEAAEEPAPEIVLDRVYFEFDKATLTPEAKRTIEKNAEILKAHPEVTVVIEGHCDERGSTEYNLALGERRAESIKNYLVQLGISPDRLSTLSYGEERPLVEGHNEAAWAKNRRGEFVVNR